MKKFFTRLNCYFGFNKTIKPYKEKWKKQFGAKTYIKIWWKIKFVAVICELKNPKCKFAQRIDNLDYQTFIKRMEQMEESVERKLSNER